MASPVIAQAASNRVGASGVKGGVNAEKGGSKFQREMQKERVGHYRIPKSTRITPGTRYPGLREKKIPGLAKDEGRSYPGRYSQPV